MTPVEVLTSTSHFCVLNCAWRFSNPQGGGATHGFSGRTLLQKPFLGIYQGASTQRPGGGETLNQRSGQLAFSREIRAV